MLFAEKDKKRKERENLPITSLPVELLAAQEPSLSNAVQEQEQDEGTYISYHPQYLILDTAKILTLSKRGCLVPTLPSPV